MNAQGWRDAAACLGEDTELFFGCDGERETERKRREARAKAVCAACPVRDTCLGWALDRNATHGVLGGMGEEERRRHRESWLARRRRNAA